MADVQNIHRIGADSSELSRFYDRHISEQKFNDSETWTVTGRSFSHSKAVKFHQLRLLGDQFWPISNHFAGKICRGQIG